MSSLRISRGQDSVERASIGCDHEVAIDELARMARSGDMQAFACLADRLRPRLLVVAGKRVGDRLADAEDIVQDTLTKAWKNIQTYDGQRSFKAWLFTIALRLAIDHSRKQRRRDHYTQQLAPPTTPPETVPQAAIKRELASNLWAIAKRELTDSQYVALWLRYAEDLSVIEVAKTMGKTRVATRVLLHRARVKLQPHIASEHQNDET